MGVYIKGMEMPKRCGGCFLRVGKCKQRIYMEDRPHDCPLVPVPPHGDLIDRAELWVEINKICDRRDAGIITDLACMQQILSAVRHSPTIIPAEEGE